MIRHMIIWKLKDDAKEGCKAEIKSALEGLVGVIDGLVSMHILTEPYECSSGDIAMDSLFESKEALEGYQVHPKHLEIANGLVRPNVSLRLSFDCEASEE